MPAPGSAVLSECFYLVAAQHVVGVNAGYGLVRSSNIEAHVCSKVLGLFGVGFWVLVSAAQAQTEAQAWALGVVAEAIIAAEKCPILRYNPMAGALLLGAARINTRHEPYRTMLAKRVIGERFSWDTNPDPFACEQPVLRRMGVIIAR